MATGKRRGKTQLARDRRRIADLYLQGWIQADIASEVGVSQATVCRDLQALQASWLDSALMNFDEAKAHELAKVDRLEREYWQAWERSCENAETITRKVKGRMERRETDDGEFIAEQPAEATKTSKGQAGDPRFLQGVQWCIDKRCKIMGIDAPQKVEVYDWRREAKEKGIDPAGIFEQLVQDAYAALQEGD
jgi:transposase